jgi:hypothetical protein
MLFRLHAFIHSIGMCRMWRFLVVLRRFFHSSLLHTFSCHSSPSTICPSTLTSSCHLFLGQPLGFVNSKLIYNNRFVILFSSSLSTCPNQHNISLLNLFAYFSAYKTHPDFFVKNFRKNNECILILVIYWKKTGLLP